MDVFKVGDKVYAEDWCYGTIIDIREEKALVEFDTERGGGSLWFDFSELEHPIFRKED